ncbi:MAG: acetyl-CoA carboxylase, carboxyltransferase subunit beta [Candidatus Sumerlaeia bacterium]|nr:acetyl-CoA carboxylase, carboxyltransferase subunit beta [Candidatus Sumerlaeia bacterium]
MAWFRKPQYTTLRATPPRDVIPEGLWFKCTECVNFIYRKDFERNLMVCPKCGAHFKMSAMERIAMLADEGTWEEFNAHIRPTDALKFCDSKPYEKRLKDAMSKGDANEAVRTGRCKIDGHTVLLSVMDFNFIGGSMGSVVGERVTRLMERACTDRLPVISVATSGGARMQESILSLMQMAKTSAACAMLARERIPYISVLTDPTTAGVMASFASLGDVIVAEPGALIGFAGPRVIQQTINQILPRGFQRSDFVLAHGFVDIVVERKYLKATLARLVSFFWDEPKSTAKVVPMAL